MTIIYCKKVWVNVENPSSSENNSFTSNNDSVCDAMQICGSQKYAGNILMEYDSVITQVPCSSLNAVICQKTAKRMERNESSQNCTTRVGQLGTYEGGGRNYSNNLNQYFNFEAKQGYRIIFELLSYDIEFQDQCLYDYIETIGMTRDKKYCGKSSEAVTFISKSFSSAIRFKTDEDITAAGFNLTWYWVKNGEAFQTMKQEDKSLITMHSVNYPHAFPDGIKNCSNVVLPDDIRLLVTIEKLALPGSHCSDSSFELMSGSNVIKTFCGGASVESLDYFSRYILTDSGNISFCLTAPQLRRGEGILLHLRQVQGNSSKLNNTITLLPNETMEFSSLMFPHMFPAKTTHDVIFRTNIGYIVTVTLNVTIRQGNQCLLDIIQLIDISLKDDSKGLKLHPCVNLTDDVDNRTEVVFRSVLNAVRLVLSSGDHTSDNSSFKISGIISSVKDPLYLNKTRRETGTFDECYENTCENGGSCLTAAEGRYTCSCQKQHTGLFCQASKCDLDLNLCDPKHAKCHLTDSGFTCECETGYWGDRCTMNSIVCQYRLCSGHGHCVQLNDTETGCLCDEFYTGPRCSILIPKPEEQLTIGQKLLKEPIWIGMIVMLNLVLFFCVSYVIRRKCGKRIARLFPKKTPTHNISKEAENSKGEHSADTDHAERNISIVSLKTPPVINRDSRWSVRKKSYREKLDSISAPSTPIVNEDNQDAAMKLFAAYNTKKPELSPNITAIQGNNIAIKTRDIMSCGIQGGTVTLYPDIEFENHSKDHAHGMLRSYTISTEIRDFESRISKARREARTKKSSSYAGSPTTSRVSKSDVSHENATPKVTHCFPEIRIINENNCEERNVSDSDENTVFTLPVEISTSQSKSAENVSEVKTSDQHDSGYPSTTISTTHDGSQVEDANLKTIPSASVKRKLFSSKAKSASFYKLGNENDTIKKEARKDTRDSVISELSFKRSTSGEFRSFESERCSSCKREQIERCAYSYETDLDKMHRCRNKRQYSAGYNGSHNHQKRHRRRRKCRCSKHHSYSKEIDFYSHDFHESPVNLQREQYMHSCHHKPSFGENWNWPRYHRNIRPINSSTESDTCLCSTHEMRCHRRHYHVKEAFSENGFLDRHASASSRDLDISPRIDFRSDGSCKSTLMKSFLSDTYRASCNVYSGSEAAGDNICQNKHFLASPQKSSLSSSRDKSRSPSPRTSSPRQLQLGVQRKRSDTVVEIANDNVIKLDVSPVSSSNSDIVQCREKSLVSPSAISLTKVYRAEQSSNGLYDNPELNTDIDSSANEQLSEAECISQDVCTNQNKMSQNMDLPNSVISYDIKPLNERLTMQKDSAYQTKQSSIDMLRRSDSLARGSNALKSKTSEKNDSQDILNRNEDRVHRHLHQAALKLALLKRLQTKDYSKDSAIHTFSEDDLSADDGETRGSFRPLIKRTSGSLAFQFRETSLSQVQEEHSGVSRDTENYNTPTNEPFCGSFDKLSTEVGSSSGIPMTDISSTHTDSSVAQLEETNI
ncbi:uncharacterized protein LOC123549434 [Mercenaria mercenaria]|uniref:uncharacterized protein LOC123549434 n=1 Tax=Mercenaria mercenaria TaxID=6596 RepID=UPI00234F0935|nr:uncharacterized protein LOC123549434 [Mercenaria mercenaria]